MIGNGAGSTSQKTKYALWFTQAGTAVAWRLLALRVIESPFVLEFLWDVIPKERS